jgi:general secretion pathway protein D
VCLGHFLAACSSSVVPLSVVPLSVGLGLTPAPAFAQSDLDDRDLADVERCEMELAQNAPWDMDREEVERVAARRAEVNSGESAERPATEGPIAPASGSKTVRAVAPAEAARSAVPDPAGTKSAEAARVQVKPAERQAPDLEVAAMVAPRGRPGPSGDAQRDEPLPQPVPVPGAAEFAPRVPAKPGPAELDPIPPADTAAPAGEAESSSAPRAQSPAPAALRDAESRSAGETKVLLDFEDVDLGDVIKAMAEIAKKSFVYDKRVEGKITIVSEAPVSAADAFRMFESTLHLKGLTIVEGSTGELMIVPIRDARRMPLEVVNPDAELPDGDVLTTKLIPLHHAKVAAVKKTVLELVANDASVIADPASNTLIVTDTAANLRRVIDVVRAIDASEFEGQIKVVRLEQADATQLAEHLQQVLGARGAPEPGVPEPQVIADVATNSLVVVATPSLLEEVERVIALLDYRRPDTSTLNIYRVQNASAGDLAKTLSSLAERSGAAGDSSGAAGAGLALKGNVKIAADPPTNSLIIQSSPRDYHALGQVIDKLDVRRPQVLIGVLMLEAEGSAGDLLGANLLHTALLAHHDGILSFDFPFPGDAFAGASGSGVSAPGAAPFGAVAPGPFASGLIPSTVARTDGFGHTERVPVIDAVLRAAQNNSDTNVISAPQILTADNEEARIVVGETRGFPTARLQAASPSGLNPGGLNPFHASTQIERQDVGITLRVTPQITEDDALRMKIFTDLSHVTNPDDPFGPTTSHREIENTVYVRNGSSVMIGGIVRDELEKTERSVPVLGRLPLIGSAFRSTSTRTVKKNLMMLITPRIVRDPADLAQASSDAREQFGAPSGVAQPRPASPEEATGSTLDVPKDDHPVRRELDELRDGDSHRALPARRKEYETPAKAGPEPKRSGKRSKTSRVHRKSVHSEKPRRTAQRAAERAAYLVQVHPVESASEAHALLEKLRKIGYAGRLFVEEDDDRLLHCIRLGPYRTLGEARRVRRAVEHAVPMKASVLFGS